jgi:hypothetical protein
MKPTHLQPKTVLATLRELVPTRALSRAEAERITELQANRLREVFGLDDPRLPEDVISDLPRVHVRREFGLPVSGITHWERGRWVISPNASEPAGRVRFSLAHEFCHVLQHPSRRYFYPGINGPERCERLADYFAGCLLMPKRHVKRLTGEGMSVLEIAHIFGVSAVAMRVRMAQLGLGEPTQRCTWNGQDRTYLRRSVPPARIAA